MKCETADWEQRGRVVRTTFHPDSDYSTFVGCYKPTTQNVPRYDIYNKLVKDERNELVMEKVITYEFVPQAFLQAYIAAWTDRETPEYLIIEEINRGNCAQIFGDLFQLLDRGDDGYSEYAIRADKDLQKHLEEAFKDIKIPDYPNVKSGEELLLPANLYIRATMNTSDQSLFPIDSAFKRRWDWQYVPIARAEGKDWKIEADGKQYDWWSFLEEINKIVFTTTNSEDKQLGFYFCKANKDGVISADTFVSKVIFYLWSDVFKDFGFDDQIFKDADGEGKLSFDKFYNGKGEVIDGKVVGFLTNLKLDPVAKENDSIIEEEEEYEEDEEEDTDDVVSTAHDHSMYSINGEGRYIKRHIAAEVMKRYVVANPDYPEEQIAKEWAQLYSPMGTFVYTAGGYNDFINAPGGKEESRKIRYIPVDLPSGGKVYVSNQFTKEKVELFNESLKSLKWPYEIKRISE
ncbi:MAG: hypothetical protein LUC26_03430 [Prevotella sp.]|nr:hypothetical protein [Prevotella sp.]